MAGILDRFFGKKDKEAPSAVAGKVVRVGVGESLRSIAKREYGDEKMWEKIYQTNKWKIDDPESIYPGMELRLP